MHTDSKQGLNTVVWRSVLSVEQFCFLHAIRFSMEFTTSFFQSSLPGASLSPQANLANTLLIRHPSLEISTSPVSYLNHQSRVPCYIFKFYPVHAQQSFYLPTHFLCHLSFPCVDLFILSLVSSSINSFVLLLAH